MQPTPACLHVRRRTLNGPPPPVTGRGRRDGTHAASRTGRRPARGDGTHNHKRNQMSVENHYWNGTILELCMQDVQHAEIEQLKGFLNETLEREGYPTIKEFELDGPEDINVKMSDGTIHEICSETTFDALFDLIGI